MKAPAHSTIDSSAQPAASRSVQLRAHRLGKTYLSRDRELLILRDIDLTLDAGDAVAIVGPSGSGKSTLLNIFGTLEPPSTGSVTLNNQNPFALDEQALAHFRNRHIGFVFQEHHLLPQCSVLENVLLPTLASRSAVSPSDIAARAKALIDRVGLGDRLDHRPAELSGGERQRVAIARALINDPNLVLADEPTGNLDRATGEIVGNLLLDVLARRDAILIVVTHSERLAERFPRRYEINDGRLIPVSV